MLLDLNKYFIKGQKELIDDLKMSHVLADALQIKNTNLIGAIKAYEMGEKLHKNNQIELDSEDKINLMNFIKEVKFMPFVEAQLIMEIENQKDK